MLTLIDNTMYNNKGAFINNSSKVIIYEIKGSVATAGKI